MDSGGESEARSIRGLVSHVERNTGEFIAFPGATLTTVCTNEEKNSERNCCGSY